MAQARGQFSSKLGFILAAAGSAVGLGNLVAFPVMASKNGGAAFLIIYLLFVAFICYPVMMAEIAMGRRAKRNPVGAFDTISGGSAKWRLTGMLAIITPFMIAVFYTVITVWLVVYLKGTRKRRSRSALARADFRRDRCCAVAIWLCNFPSCWCVFDSSRRREGRYRASRTSANADARNNARCTDDVCIDPRRRQRRNRLLSGSRFYEDEFVDGQWRAESGIFLALARYGNSNHLWLVLQP